MWHALRAELAYSRPALLGSLGIAGGVLVIVTVILWAVGGDGPPPHAAAGIRAMFLVMAPLIAGFVIQAYRVEEHRDRLLLSGPLTPRQLAGVAVLLPVVLFGLGLLAAALMLGAEAAITGRLAMESAQMAAFVGGLILAMQMIFLLVQEAGAAHRERHLRRAFAGWAALALAVAVLAAATTVVVLLQGPWSWPVLHLANPVSAAIAAVATVRLYADRGDFTR